MTAKSPVAYGVPLLFVPLLMSGWMYGGIFILLAPIFGYLIITLIDLVVGESTEISISVKKSISKYKIILFVWPLVQFLLLFGSLYVISFFDHLSHIEAIGLMMVQGMITGAVGITFAHELMHRRTKIERFLADFLMGMAVYGHFRTEHVLVHHRFVGTKKDAVTARFNESFYLFFLRVIPACFVSAWQVERKRLSIKNRNVFSYSNPFFIYFLTAFSFLFLSYIIAGFWGIMLFFLQAFIAILHLEVVNYIEHYGLVRQKMEDNKYEPTRPHHSWNANHKASNLLLINLQKHSDHHAKPSRDYPLLDSHADDTAPQLPFGYPIMVCISLVPFVWRKIMNPKVLAWRKQFYPSFDKWETLQ